MSPKLPVGTEKETFWPASAARAVAEHRGPPRGYYAWEVGAGVVYVFLVVTPLAAFVYYAFVMTEAERNAENQNAAASAEGDVDADVDGDAGGGFEGDADADADVDFEGDDGVVGGGIV